MNDDGPAIEELFSTLPYSADWTMGFLTAICSGPTTISSTTWIPVIVPEGTSADDPAARKRVDTLARLCGAVVETLANNAEVIPPDPDRPIEEAADFSRGYVRGAQMHAPWQADETATAMLVPFVALAGRDREPNPDERVHHEHLGTSVAELRAYWQAKRQVVHATPKVGRNDPCPCGSGKKHKKCCA